MLVDTNGDGLVDSIAGKVIVPDSPSSGENAAAANVAARLGHLMIGSSTQSAVATQGAAANLRHWFDFRAAIVPYEVADREAGSQ